MALSTLDRWIGEFDRALRTVGGVVAQRRESPAAALPEPELARHERAESAALMRVNHAGEVCAQALYRGQALGATSPALQESLAAAAREEEDHLAWSAERISALGGRTSLLNPLFYAGSFAIGYLAGRAGDRWSLGFLKETERQVEAHLEGHLQRLSPRDAPTRAIVAQMAGEEAGHARTADRLGARDLPLPARAAMRACARVMTTATYIA